MSQNIAAGFTSYSGLLRAPNTARAWATVELTQRSQRRTPYLVFVWITIALGVVAVFEPSPSDIGIALLFVVGFVTGTLQWSRRLTLPFIVLGLFVLANLISLTYAPDLERGALYFAITIFMLLSWLFIVGVLTKYGEQGLRALMLAFTFGGVASALIAILCYFNLAPFAEWVLFYDRIKGFFKDPNVFGPYLVIVSVYALQRVVMGGTLKSSSLWLSYFLISSTGVLLCYSRAAWMNYAVTLVLFFGLNSAARRGAGAIRKNLIYLAIFTVIVGSALGYAMTIPQINEVLSYRTELQTYDLDRFATYGAALRMGFGNPLGVGPAQSFTLLDYATHNVYLRVFAENGVIGLLSFTTFILITLIRSVALSQTAPRLFQRSLFALVAASLCGTLLNSLTIDTLHWRHFWLLLALGWMPLWPNHASSTCSGSSQHLTAASSL